MMILLLGKRIRISVDCREIDLSQRTEMNDPKMVLAGIRMQLSDDQPNRIILEQLMMRFNNETGKLGMYDYVFLATLSK